jgi:SAM-dependent methyltransferase
VNKAIDRGRLSERVPKALRACLAEGQERATDVFGRVSAHDPLTPPARLQNVGEGDFGAVGEAIVHYLQALADLKSSDRVLDIGCGVGRVARVLARELQPPGSYDGFDIVPESVSWCQRHYRRTRAPFRFTHADVRNTAYNPNGLHDAVDYEFPYASASFDLVIAISVFTHLLPASADRYLSEARRVLAPGGRVFLTCFLLTDAPAPAPAFDFQPIDEGAAVANPDVPEAAVAYSEHGLRERLAANALRVREPIQFGSWRGTRSICYQDLVVADRS